MICLPNSSSQMSSFPNPAIRSTSRKTGFWPLFSQVPFSSSYRLDGSEQEIYRIGFNVPGEQGPPPSRPPLSYLQEHLNTIGPLMFSSDSTVNPEPVHISVLWSSRFWTHAAIADKFVFRLHNNFPFLITVWHQTLSSFLSIDFTAVPFTFPS